MKATLLQNTHDMPLSEPSPVAVPVGEPVPHTRVHSVERSDGVETGRGYKPFPPSGYPAIDMGSKKVSSWIGWQVGISWRYGRL